MLSIDRFGSAIQTEAPRAATIHQFLQSQRWSGTGWHRVTRAMRRGEAPLPRAARDHPRSEKQSPTSEPLTRCSRSGPAHHPS